MKITQESLNVGVVYTKQNLNVTKTHAISQYNKKDFDLTQEQSEEIYCKDVFQYIDNNPEWQVAEHLKDAIEKRLSGTKALSLREFDTLTRHGIELCGLFVDSLMSDMTLFVTEGSPALIIKGESFDPWLLRAKYNKGLQWKKDKRDKLPESDKVKGDLFLAKIIQRLKDMSIPLFKSELENGIHNELTKPEYMTWDQYTKSLQCKSKLIEV